MVILDTVYGLAELAPTPDKDTHTPCGKEKFWCVMKESKVEWIPVENYGYVDETEVAAIYKIKK